MAEGLGVLLTAELDVAGSVRTVGAAPTVGADLVEEGRPLSDFREEMALGRAAVRRAVAWVRVVAFANDAPEYDERPDYLSLEAQSRGREAELQYVVAGADRA